MAKIVEQIIEVSVCAQDTYSPVKITQRIALADSEGQVPPDLEKWCLEHCKAVAVEYAKAIRTEMFPQETAPQPQTEMNVNYGGQQGYNAPNYNNNGGNKGYKNNNNYQNQNYNQGGGFQGNQGGNEIEQLLNTSVQGLFGNSKPQGFQTFGMTLRACSNKELNFIAYQCKKSQNTMAGANARRLLQLGYQGI